MKSSQTKHGAGWTALGGWVLAGCMAVACGGDDVAANSPTGDGGVTGPDGSVTVGGGGGGGGGDGSTSTGVKRLGRDHFLIGLGNDDDNAFALGEPLDLRYLYLVRGFGTDWKTYSPNATYVDESANNAKTHGMIPMFTFYELFAAGDGNVSVLQDQNEMKQFWADVKIMLEHLATFNDLAVVHYEPDFWGYVLNKGADPTKVPALVTIAADCTDLPNDASGVGRCLMKMTRKYAPKVFAGLHASDFAQVGGKAVGEFMKKLTNGEGDFVALDILDRDVGCYEAKGPECARDGEAYWDETNTKSPNFHEHLAFAKALHDASQLPLLWWQTPLGVPSDAPGGNAGHYRDNRVHYIFSHISEFADAGGMGVVFGNGQDQQTTTKTDGGQFKKAAHDYYANPFKL